MFSLRKCFTGSNFGNFLTCQTFYVLCNCEAIGNLRDTDVLHIHWICEIQTFRLLSPCFELIIMKKIRKIVNINQLRILLRQEWPKSVICSQVKWARQRFQPTQQVIISLYPSIVHFWCEEVTQWQNTVSFFDINAKLKEFPPSSFSTLFIYSSREVLPTILILEMRSKYTWGHGYTIITYCHLLGNSETKKWLATSDTATISEFVE